MRDLAQIEQDFATQAERARAERERVLRDTERREAARRRERVHKRGSYRFLLLWLTLVATAVVVTIVMFQMLYVVMG